uniref:Uncharacterized protein n=1 Tax=Eutreptiella gymnastica TaxID=73025 RepID=A0A6U7U9P6_9EUGL|mmetsp:Transcript_121825/g.211534  ORF Transcript_121825/g.211534 Transcript_121825/m.211534 type:complete len:111 (+) Transcript_121825:221-553(+)
MTMGLLLWYCQAHCSNVLPVQTTILQWRGSYPSGTTPSSPFERTHVQVLGLYIPSLACPSRNIDTPFLCNVSDAAFTFHCFDLLSWVMGDDHFCNFRDLLGLYLPWACFT